MQAAEETPKPKSSKKSKKGANGEDDDRSNDPTVGVGSVAAGGRYDNLVGMFQPKAQIPCVGVSFGVDRIFSITKARLEREQSTDVLRNSEVDAFVMAFGGKGFTGMLKERMSVCQSLWNAGLKVGLFFSFSFLSFCLFSSVYIYFVELTHPGRILLQSQAQTAAAIQSRRARRRPVRGHPGRRRDGRRQGAHQGDGAGRRPPGEGGRAG